MAQIRFVACLIILALSAGAADTNSTGTVDASQAMNELGKLTGKSNQTKAAYLRSTVACPCRRQPWCCWLQGFIFWEQLDVLAPWPLGVVDHSSRQSKANFGDEESAWERLLRQQGDLQNSALSRSFVIEKVCMFMPVSLHKLDIQCIHAWYKDKPFQNLRRLAPTSLDAHHTNLFHVWIAVPLTSRWG